jgi:serine/threonine-protein kinase
MTDELIGKMIGGYEILDVIGRGGMATVYRAQQVSMNRIVAVKVLPEKFLNDDSYLQRFNQEVAIVAKLEHRNIVPVYDYGEFNGQPYIVMRYMSGGSVDDRLSDGPLEPEYILNIFEQVAPALDYAHGKNVLHRDLKPSNVLLDDDGGAYITDFGIARVLGEQNSSGITTQGVVGTPSYMSPEQAQGQPLDGRSDIYAMGIMLFELATGRRPFEGDTPYGIAVLQVTTPPPSPRTYNPRLSFAVEEVIFRALRKKAEDRYPTTVALTEGLKKALNKSAINLHDTQPGGIQRPQPPQQNSSVPPAPPMQMASAPMTGQPVYNVQAVPRMTPPPVSGFANKVRRRRSRPSNIWVSAAVGGLLGCGVLAVLAIIVLIIINIVGSGSPIVPTVPASLDDGSGQEHSSLLLTVVPNPAATRVTGDNSTDPTGIAPVGVRPTGTLSADVQSAGGMLVYFAERSDNYDLYKLSLATSAEQQLTFDEAIDSYPNVSPDGRYIAFQSNRDGDFDIYVMDIDGNNLRQLTDNTILDRIPSWTPDGEWITFSSDTRNDNTFDLYQIHPDGSGLRLVFSNGQRNSYANYSPDSFSIVFTTGDAQDAATWEIGRLETESQDFADLTDNNYKDWSPSFSPNGRTIIYLTAEVDGSNAIGDSAITVMNSDGSNQHLLYDGPGYEWGASFSPDSRFVTFTARSPETSQEEIFLMRADGTDVQQVTNGGGQGASWVPVS